MICVASIADKVCGTPSKVIRGTVLTMHYIKSTSIITKLITVM